MGIGALIGAFVFGGAAAIAGGTLTLFGASLGLWQAVAVGASIGSLFDSGPKAPSPNYTLNPISNTTSQIIPVPVVYGKCRVAGNIFYQQFQNRDQKIVYQHVGFSEGPVKAINSSDVMVNDYTTAELSTISKEVFLGTADQAPNQWDPEGCAYPYVAYVALKMEASAKVQGNPVITAVITGRDIAFPGSEAKGFTKIGADATATGGFNYTVQGEAAYKHSDVTARCWGDDGGYEPDPAGWWITFYSDLYPGTTDDAIICIPMWFRMNKASVIRVYPNSATGTYYQFDINGFDKPKVKSAWGTSGVKIGWEPLKKVISEDFGGYVTQVSGILTVLIPAALIPSGGKAKIVCGISSYDYTLGVVPYGIGGLLPYTDAETEAPNFFDFVAGYNNPAWCAWDFLTNRRYGAGIPEAYFDLDSFQEVAARCEEEGLALNLVIDTQKPTLDHLKEILAPARAYLVVRDRVKLRMDAPVTSYSRHLTAADIVDGSFTYWSAARDQIPNRVTVEYIDGDGSGDGGTWEQTSYSIEDWDDITDRGIYERRLSVLGITSKAQAKAMANYLFEQARRCRTYCTFAAALNLSDVEVGDVVAITHDLPGWQEKWMRVIGVEDGQDCTVAIKCIEYDPVVYDTSDDV